VQAPELKADAESVLVRVEECKLVKKTVHGRADAGGPGREETTVTEEAPSRRLLLYKKVLPRREDPSRVRLRALLNFPCVACCFRCASLRAATGTARTSLPWCRCAEPFV
jgi:hypothetical protein